MVVEMLFVVRTLGCMVSASVIVCWYFFFFKQKTAYEMRISDWSSDVCSSDLTQAASRRGAGSRTDRDAAVAARDSPDQGERIAGSESRGRGRVGASQPGDRVGDRQGGRRPFHRRRSRNEDAGAQGRDGHKPGAGRQGDRKSNRLHSRN